MSTDQRADIDTAYQWCHNLANSHYENFPVASWLLPRQLRNPVAAIYAFARTADDIADEGDALPSRRIEQLEQMSRQLEAGDGKNTPHEPVYIALFDTIQRHQLPLHLFQDLLSAFRQDVEKTRYGNVAELLDYCSRSANPIGRLLLYLNAVACEKNLEMSDTLCTALQLINFLQDIHSDHLDRGRIYLPRDEMVRFGLSEEDIRSSSNSPAMRKLVDFQIRRCRQLLDAGSPLAKSLHGRFAVELRAIILGARRVLGKLEHQQDMFRRPRLGRRDRILILLAACAPQPNIRL